MRLFIGGVLVCVMFVQGAQADVWHRLPRFEANARQQTWMTSSPGMYVVVVKTRNQHRAQTIDGTETYLDSGELLGFRMNEQAHLVAFTARGEIDLGAVRGGMKSICWMTHRQHTGREQASRREGAKVAGDVAGDVLGFSLDSVLHHAIDRAADNNLKHLLGNSRKGR